MFIVVLSTYLCYFLGGSHLTEEICASWCLWLLYDFLLWPCHIYIHLKHIIQKPDGIYGIQHSTYLQFEKRKLSNVLYEFWSTMRTANFLVCTAHSLTSLVKSICSYAITPSLHVRAQLVYSFIQFTTSSAQVAKGLIRLHE